MKRMVMILTIVALILSFSNVSMAQITEKGVKVGLNMANITGDEADELFPDDPENKTGFAIGGYVLYPLNETITMRIEALYSQKGAKASGEMDHGYYYYYGGGSVDYKAEATVTYLEIPVLFQYDIESSGSMKPFVFAGPFLALKMSDKYKMTIDGDTESGDIDDLKGSDYGIVIGAGAKINEKIFIDLRYSMGMTTIVDIDDVDVKTKVIAIMAGYALN
ncbi:PorT family protein [candidate division KSB1 bacterium]|nr:PorT family protein [candidate division KSB1 bacterium]